MDVEGGLVALQYFSSLKNGSIVFNFLLNESSPDFLGPLVRYDHPWKEQKTNKNKHASVLFLLAKMENSTFLQTGA
jgi:hypothetical protein